jgi:mxaA protein
VRNVLVLVLALWPGVAAAQLRATTVLLPSRDFGYFVGDTLTSGIEFLLAPGTRLDERSLPPPGPINGLVDLRHVIVTRNTVAAGQRVIIRATYQLFFSPLEVASLHVPGYSVSFLQGQRRVVALVPGFAVLVSPFRHDLRPEPDPALVRPDRTVARTNTGTFRKELWVGVVLAAFGSLGLAWSNGWLSAPSRQRPFARAASSMRQLTRTSDSGATMKALLILHRAFDATAGRRIFADDLEAFFRHHRNFVPLQGDIEAFFLASRDAFFSALPRPSSISVTALARLSRGLASAERAA